MKTKGEMIQLPSDEALLTFHDVAACFSAKEWNLLHKWQKEVYNNVMKELHQALTSLGPVIGASIFSVKAPVNEDLTFEDNQHSEMIYNIECNTRYPVSKFDNEMTEEQACESSLVEHSTAEIDSQNSCLPEHGSTNTFESVMIKEEEDEMDFDKSDGTESISRPVDIPYCNVKILDEHQYTEEEESHIGLNADIPYRNVKVLDEHQNAEEQESHIELNSDIPYRNVKVLDEHQNAEEQESHIGLNSGSSFFNTDIANKDEEEVPEQSSKLSFMEHTVIPSSGSSFYNMDIASKEGEEVPEQSSKAIFTEHTVSASSGGSSFFNMDIKSKEGEEVPEQSSKAIFMEHTVSASSDFRRKTRRKTKLWLKNTKQPKQYATSPEASTEKEYQFNETQQYSSSAMSLENAMEGQSQSATEYGSAFCITTQSGLHKFINNKAKCEKYDCESTLMQAEVLTFKPNTKKILEPRMINEREETSSVEGNLIANIRKSTREKTLHCTKCGKNFSQKKNLSRHQRIHKEEKKKPYYCTVCEKTFSLKYHLVTHMQIHSGERPYKCTECNKTFNRKSNLSTHSRLHSGDRPFECTECEKCFSQKSHLIAHKSKHTGAKPYQCTKCHKCFIYKGSLVRHKCTHSY